VVWEWWGDGACWGGVLVWDGWVGLGSGGVHICVRPRSGVQSSFEPNLTSIQKPEFA
jgi:hypothetical protein